MLDQSGPVPHLPQCQVTGSVLPGGCIPTMLPGAVPRVSLSAPNHEISSSSQKLRLAGLDDGSLSVRLLSEAPLIGKPEIR